MARIWIVVGDTTSSGGSVVTGSPFTDINGKPVARVGDAVVCGQHGSTTIASGDFTLSIDGQAVARQGDKCACGCVLMPVSQMQVFIDEGAAPATKAASVPSATAAPASTLASAGSGGPAGDAATALAAAGQAEQPGPDSGNEGQDEPSPAVEAVELGPDILDEDGGAVADSTVPRPVPHRHPMVKIDPHSNRIAHRDIRIRVFTDGHDPGVHAGKTVTWTMEPLFVPPAGGDARFRGDWAQAAQGHRDRFEASEEFGAHDFARTSQEQATTTVDDTGHSAIRVNLPPIAFNAARISAHVDGMEVPQALIDLEVPGIIVIDPGHGGSVNVDGSSANNATSHTSGILEKDMTLDFALRTRAALRAVRDNENQNLRIHMTRTVDENKPAIERARTGRDNGADILLSIHFNGFNKSARGTETLIRRASDNVNTAQDRALAQRVNDAVYQTIFAHDPDARDRGVKEQQLAVLSDASLGNTASYHPLRSALVEIEFIDNQAVDELLSIREGHEQVRQDICDAIAGALIEDLLRSP